MTRLALKLACLAIAVVAGCRTQSSTPAPRVILRDGEPATPAAVAQSPLASTQPLAEQIETTAPASATQATTLPAAATTMPATTRAASLADQLESILTRRRETGARVSARVIDPETGAQLFAYDAGRPMVPASNMKLMATTAALDFFGPDHVLETNLTVVGQDLWLVGTGDPAAGDEPIEKQYGRTQTSLFDDWADELIAKGVKNLAGNLYYVDGAFERQQLHPTWAADDRIEWYAAPVAGLNLNDNCVDTIVTPATQPTAKPTVQMVPPTTASIVVVNNAVNAVNGEPQDLEVTRAMEQNVYTVAGKVAKVTKLQSKPVTDPGAFFADALRTHLASRGITVAGAIVRGDALPEPSAAAPRVQLKPARSKFTDVLWRVNKNSQNLFAEATAKYLGRAFAQQADRDSMAVGSWANADKAIRAFLAKNEIDAGGFVFADGSGLSRDNRVTTRLLSDILATMYRHAYFDAFKKSLTVAGVDGTTRSRFKDLPNRVFCKTGYISGVRSLSGYVVTDAGKTLVFSIVYNNIPGRGIAVTKPFEELQDEALRLLMKYPMVQ